MVQCGHSYSMNASTHHADMREEEERAEKYTRDPLAFKAALSEM